MNKTPVFELSAHAELRALERTQLTPEALVKQLNTGAMRWIRKSNDGLSKHALVYCASTDTFVVAVIALPAGTVKTVLTQHQWESTYGAIQKSWQDMAKELTWLAVQVSRLDLRLFAKKRDDPSDEGVVLFELTEAECDGVFGSMERQGVHAAQLQEKMKRGLRHITKNNEFVKRARQCLDAHPEVLPTTHSLIVVVGPRQIAPNLLQGFCAWDTVVPAADIFESIGRHPQKLGGIVVSNEHNWKLITAVLTHWRKQVSQNRAVLDDRVAARARAEAAIEQHRSSARQGNKNIIGSLLSGRAHQPG